MLGESNASVSGLMLRQMAVDRRFSSCQGKSNMNKLLLRSMFLNFQEKHPSPILTVIILSLAGPSPAKGTDWAFPFKNEPR